MADFKRYSGILLKNKDKVLLCKRSPEESLANQWSLPSGHIEGKETPSGAALREFYEETNIKLKNDIDLVGFINKYKKDGVTKRGIMYVFKSETNTEILPDLDKAKDGHEHTKCKYFSKNEIPVGKNNEQLLEIIKKIFK